MKDYTPVDLASPRTNDDEAKLLVQKDESCWGKCQLVFKGITSNKTSFFTTVILDYWDTYIDWMSMITLAMTQKWVYFSILLTTAAISGFCRFLVRRNQKRSCFESLLAFFQLDALLDFLGRIHRNHKGEYRLTKSEKADSMLGLVEGVFEDYTVSLVALWIVLIDQDYTIFQVIQSVQCLYFLGASLGRKYEYSKMESNWFNIIYSYIYKPSLVASKFILLILYFKATELVGLRTYLFLHGMLVVLFLITGCINYFRLGDCFLMHGGAGLAFVVFYLSAGSLPRGKMEGTPLSGWSGLHTFVNIKMLLEGLWLLIWGISSGILVQNEYQKQYQSIEQKYLHVSLIAGVIWVMSYLALFALKRVRTCNIDEFVKNGEPNGHEVLADYDMEDD